MRPLALAATLSHRSVEGARLVEISTFLALFRVASREFTFDASATAIVACARVAAYFARHVSL